MREVCPANAPKSQELKRANSDVQRNSPLQVHRELGYAANHNLRSTTRDENFDGGDAASWGAGTPVTALPSPLEVPFPALAP